MKIAPSPERVARVKTPDSIASGMPQRASLVGQEDVEDAEETSAIVNDMRYEKRGLYYDEGNFFRDSMTPVGFISPTSEFQEYWDMSMLALMIYVIFVTPFEVSFLTEVSIAELLFWVNRIVDSFFLCDMVSGLPLLPLFIFASDSIGGPLDRWCSSIQSLRRTASTWMRCMNSLLVCQPASVELSSPVRVAPRLTLTLLPPSPPSRRV